jgi:hypothetical protein
VKPGVHVVEIRDEKGNLYRKAVDTGCWTLLQKAAMAWLGRLLWFLVGFVVGIVLGS